MATAYALECNYLQRNLIGTMVSTQEKQQCMRLRCLIFQIDYSKVLMENSIALNHQHVFFY